jgi:ACS family hexuronate transporter-like MFS transporter
MAQGLTTEVARVPPPATSPRADGERPLRWAIVSLLFLATLINYIDRQTVAVLAPVLKEKLALSNQDYATIANAFLAAYTLSMWLWGAVFDRLGNRRGYALAVGLWSLSAVAHALAASLHGFRLVRVALGASESGNWPGATRSVAAWFLPRPRALAMGIVNCGAALGSAVAPPVVWALQARWGWQAAFLVTGSLGFLWLLAWWIVYPAGTSERAPARAPAVSWRLLVGRRQFWAIVVARFFGDPIWWLYLNWLPLYLHNARGWDLKAIALSAWIPYLAADLGCVAGGWLSGHLIGRGLSVDRARKTALLLGTLLMPAGTAAAFVSSPVAALACISLTLFGFQFWVGNVQTLASDMFPVGAVGSIAGFAGTAAGLGAMILTHSTGWVVDHFSYTPILITAGALAPVATGALFLLAGRIRPVALPGHA